MDRPIDIYNDFEWLFRAESGQWCNNDTCRFINTMDQQHLTNAINLLNRTEQEVISNTRMTKNDKLVLLVSIESKRAELQAAITR